MTTPALLILVRRLEGEDLGPTGSNGQYHGAGVEFLACRGCHGEDFGFLFGVVGGDWEVGVQGILDISYFAVQDCTGTVEAVAVDDGGAVVGE